MTPDNQKWKNRKGRRVVECKTCHRDRNRESWRAKGALPGGKYKTHCPAGHPLVEGNLRNRPSRECLTCHRNRENFRGRLPDQETADYIQILRKDPCVYCGGPGRHIDHIVPYALGGMNSWENLASTCHSCNSKKRTSSVLSFMLKRK